VTVTKVEDKPLGSGAVPPPPPSRYAALSVSPLDIWKVVAGYVLGAASLIALLVIAFVVNAQWWLNLLCIIFGGTFGWIVGILTTPKTSVERRQFIRYGQAITAFASGFVVAKFDKAIESAIASRGINDVLIARLLLFGSAFCLGALFTFVGRRFGK
jgi:hypothetical protein